LLIIDRDPKNFAVRTWCLRLSSATLMRQCH